MNEPTLIPRATVFKDGKRYHVIQEGMTVRVEGTIDERYFAQGWNKDEARTWLVSLGYAISMLSD